MKANTHTSIFWVISFQRINTVLTGFFWSLSMLYLTNNSNNTGVPKPEILRPNRPVYTGDFCCDFSGDFCCDFKSPV